MIIKTNIEALFFNGPIATTIQTTKAKVVENPNDNRAPPNIKKKCKILIKIKKKNITQSKIFFFIVGSV